MNAKDILTHYQNFAVIGVTTNPDKFGYKIYQRLNEIEKTVYGVSLMKIILIIIKIVF